MPSGRTPRPPSAKRLGRRLGQAIRKRREELEPIPSVVAVAQEAGISVDALRKIERGEVADPGFFAILRLCRVLKFSPAEVERKVLGRRR